MSVEIYAVAMPVSLVTLDPAVELLPVNLLKHRTSGRERAKLPPGITAENGCLLVNLVQDTPKNILPTFVGSYGLFALTTL